MSTDNIPKVYVELADAAKHSHISEVLTATTSIEVGKNYLVNGVTLQFAAPFTMTSAILAEFQAEVGPAQWQGNVALPVGATVGNLTTVVSDELLADAYSVNLTLDTPGLDTEITPSKGVRTAITALKTLLETPTTDRQIALDIAGGVSTLASTGAISGTWTVSEGASDNVQIVTRTAAASDVYYRIPIRIPKRTTASKGTKLTSVTVSYTVGGTIDTAADIIQIQILKQTMGADGSAPTASILAGDDDADYDASHNTNTKRLGAASHTLTVTIPAGEQAYAGDLESRALRVRVKDASTANMTFVLLGAMANYTETDH
jgi:hypothetical protein